MLWGATCYCSNSLPPLFNSNLRFGAYSCRNWRVRTQFRRLRCGFAGPKASQRRGTQAELAQRLRCRRSATPLFDGLKPQRVYFLIDVNFKCATALPFGVPVGNGSVLGVSLQIFSAKAGVQARYLSRDLSLSTMSICCHTMSRSAEHALRGLCVLRRGTPRAPSPLAAFSERDLLAAIGAFVLAE